ncbi:hypothetical protein [Enterobacter hormaechei]|nr:hypothetical protein [Enterobacter hormaechei]MDY3570254.1 hypothetical protein [Enterobacter hormaechei]
MTWGVIAWMFIVLLVLWTICGVASLVAGGYLWPFEEDDDENE